ncbi:MAG: CDP-glucose 4,6-dehydratase [Candidatus Pacebacteria bacterium]|nr:CDP-glucose 4,6-dehydratase [Candidatus Paceibacterota bacterium]
MKSFYNNKKVLITGHTGFKGSWLSQILINFGSDVVGVSLEPNTTPSLFEELGIKNKCKNYFVDIRNENVLKKIFEDERPEIVFHLAAQAIVRTSYNEPVNTISTNVMGTAHVLEAVRNSESVKSVVIITTDKVYENKEWHHAYRENDALGGYDPYSSSKAAADIITNSYIQSFFNIQDFEKKHTTLVAIARAGNVIGGGDWAEFRLIPDIVKAVYHEGKDVEIRNPDSVRPWQHVLEPLSGYLLLAQGLYEKKKVLSGSWNFGPNNESFVSVQNLVEGGKEILGKGGYKILKDTSKHEATLLKLDINKAIAVLGWKPKLTFQETLTITFDWYKNYYDKREEIVEFTNKQINIFFK